MAGWKLKLFVLVVFLYATLTAVDRHFKCHLPSIANSLVSTFPNYVIVHFLILSSCVLSFFHSFHSFVFRSFILSLFCSFILLFFRSFESFLCSLLIQLFVQLFQCSAYKAGEISGTLCSDLCVQNNIHFGKCLSEVVEDQVYGGQWQGREVIFKANMRWFSDFKNLPKRTDNDVVLSFQDDVSFWVETMFGECSRCNKLVSLLLSLGDSDGDKIVTASEARTLVSLLYQQEPFMLIALNDSKKSADFYGYCGGLYATEKLPVIASDVFGASLDFDDLNIVPDTLEPLQEMVKNLIGNILDASYSIPYIGPILNDARTIAKQHLAILNTYFHKHIPSQREKFEFLHSLLDTALDLSSNPYGMVQSCDIHLGNFGITNNSVVKMIDFDLVYPDVYLKTILEQKECASDVDCWVGTKEDCQSSCDIATNTCTPFIQKQDLLHICETHIPFVLRRPSNPELSQHNSTCLNKAIRRFILFCQKLTVANSAEELRHDVLTVKEKLRYLERNFSEMC